MQVTYRIIQRETRRIKHSKINAGKIPEIVLLDSRFSRRKYADQNSSKARFAAFFYIIYIILMIKSKYRATQIFLLC